MLKALAGHFPVNLQVGLKRLYYRRLIRRERFTSDEPEFSFLGELLRRGDVAIDVGANVGAYTRRMACVVENAGHIIAIEPIRQTFQILSSNTWDLPNVTLLNAAASYQAGWASMEVPHVDGIENFYRASITPTGRWQLRTMTLDSLELDRVALIKIDTEGHELEVLQGAETLLLRHRPILIIETGIDGRAVQWLRHHGYEFRCLENSPNVLATYRTRSVTGIESMGKV